MMPQLVTCDVSFISVRHILPVIAAVAATGATVIILVKPQFEVGKGQLGKDGVVRDTLLISRVVAEVTTAAVAAGVEVIAVLPSRVTGERGNQEYFLLGRTGCTVHTGSATDAMHTR
jgi:23S rRNA (cytidine1920-2'-O)/16S rRNA (cytidine1409-2'-O)-methyltransferase